MIGALGDEAFRPCSVGGLMKCPTCGENTPDAWERLIVNQNVALGSSSRYELPDPVPEIRRDRAHRVHFDQMYCAAKECGQLVVRGHDTSTEYDSERLPRQTTDTWIVHPRTGSRPLDPLVRKAAEPLARDYAEAAALLDVSPRMSAVLARSILADLLEQYVKLDDFNLTDRVDKFREDKSHPSTLREHMHHFREIANFGAHTQKNDQDQIIEVDREGAAWLLDYLDRLMDYLIVGPEKDRQMARKWDQNLQDAGRKPIPPLGDGEEP